MPPTGSCCEEETYNFCIIADLDSVGSRHPEEANTWQSFLKKGTLTRSKTDTFSVTWNSRETYTSTLNEKGRGFELSDLKAFNGNLYTVDDRTGIVYNLYEGKSLPWVILNDGNGMVQKGFKGEWMTIKDGLLYIGGHGREMTDRGAIISTTWMWVKTVDSEGRVNHYDWSDVYEKERNAVSVKFPGYVTNESVCWSDVTKRWNFLPRKLSQEQYDNKADETSCTNVLISCDENFDHWKVVTVGEVNPTQGYSSFKFLPGSHDEICVALKSTEIGDEQKTYITVFSADGCVLMEPTVIDELKYEGLEFL